MWKSADVRWATMMPEAYELIFLYLKKKQNNALLFFCNLLNFVLVSEIFCCKNYENLWQTIRPNLFAAIGLLENDNRNRKWGKLPDYQIYSRIQTQTIQTVRHLIKEIIRWPALQNTVPEWPVRIQNLTGFDYDLLLFITWTGK